MHARLKEIYPSLKVWTQQSNPSEKYDICVFEFSNGKCWDIVNWMNNLRQEHNLLMVCCYNTPWGLAKTPMHCLVNNMGVYWFNNIDEMTNYIMEFMVKE